MTAPSKSEAELLQENAELCARLEEADETLRAIRAGEVDALVMGEEVYTLKGAETPYRVLIEQMYEGAATLGDDGTVLYANRRLAALLGIPLQEIIGASLRRFAAPSELPAFDKLLAESKQSPTKGEFNLQRQDGSTLPAQLSFSVVSEQDARPICVIATDLSQRKRAEVALREAHDRMEQRVAERTAELRRSEALYRGIGESIDYGVWVCAPDGRNTYASPSFLKMVGITQQQCSDFGWGDVLHPEDAERTIAAWKECVRTGGNWDIEHRFRGADDQWHHILARGVPVKDEQGNLLCWAGINLDISRLKQAEEALRLSNSIQAGVNQILHAGLTCKTEDALGRACLAVAEKLTQSKFGFIGEINKEGLEYIAVSSPSLAASNVLDDSGQRVIPRNFKIHGIYGRVIKDGKALFTNDPAHHPDSIELPTGHFPLQSFLGVPLIREGRVTGIIAVANREGGYTQAQQDTLEVLRPAVVEAFIRKRAEAALHASNEELSRFNRAMVGRELRMIELKQEINVLCAALGRPPAYPLHAEKAEPETTANG